jgi:hypothetical protein
MLMKLSPDRDGPVEVSPIVSIFFDQQASLSLHSRSYYSTIRFALIRALSELIFTVKEPNCRRKETFCGFRRGKREKVAIWKFYASREKCRLSDCFHIVISLTYDVFWKRFPSVARL